MPVDPHSVTLFSHPFITIKVLAGLLFELLLSFLHALRNKYFLTTLVLSVATLILLPVVRQITWFVSFWLLAGIASSIGLGTGLHTFVLYVLPHVASVMTASTKCNGMAPPMLPSRYNFQYFGQCPQIDAKPWMSILWAIEFQAILWGAGSAIGQLPPYFIARQAARSKQQLSSQVGNNVLHPQQEAQTLNQLSKQEGIEETSEEVKQFLITSLKKYGFITILILASIPNPFFDLAGLACGHFGIPLATFFSATFIGKSFIKVHVQILMVLFILSEEFLQILLNTVDQYYPKLHPGIVDFVQHQKSRLFSQSVQQSTWIQTVWSAAIVLMVSYFLVSIVNAVVQRKLAKEQEEPIQL